MPRRVDLTDRERLFVREYLVDLNAARAAVRAGYSPKAAKVTACRIRNRSRVKAAIDAALAERAAKLEITTERVLREMALLAFANVLDYFTPLPDGTAHVDLSGLTREQAAAIADLTVEEFVSGRGAAGRDVRRVKVKLADKSRNLELIGKHLGMFARKPSDREEEGTGDDVELSDLELAQRILGLLAGASKGEADEGDPSA